jgi:acetyl/propionyl-CoA carboxylase alpha subunit/acetyl-CoA carboxylase carboxyltransferase component
LGPSSRKDLRPLFFSEIAALKNLLIANRGEVAVRVARAARTLGARAHGVFAADDEGAPYLAFLDGASALPGSGPAAYLDVAAIMAAARAAGADALHPGWGFLSENPALARACEAAGLVFVGAAAGLLDVLGDKRLARAAAVTAGVKVAAAAADLAGAADLLRDGPVMLKPVSGGGGRGMRVVTDAARLADAWQAAAAEAAVSFGGDAIFAERLIEGARHVEVQIAADGVGAVSLGTRDCSLQRRRQKLVEVAPALAHPALEQAALEQAACAMARALGYRGLGTWEFLVGGGGFWFMEVNPRLQVEHSVTEAVTGLDLVAIQLRLAEGATLAALGLDQPPVPRGVAMQFRINAETLTASGDVVPEGGRIMRFSPPGGPGIRVDHAVAEGMVVGTAYDSLLCKLIVQGGDRMVCLARAAAALSEFRIEGVRTGLPMLRRLVTLEDMRADRIDTRFLERVAGQIAAPEGPRGEADASVVTAPMAGVLVALEVAAGEFVRAGQRVAVIEAMKMQMEVTSAGAGMVVRLAVTAGDQTLRGQVLMSLALSDAQDAAGVAEVAAPDAIRPDLAALLARVGATLDAARPGAVAKRHLAGRRTARENLDDLFDAGSFSEYGALAVAAQRRRRPMEELIRISPADGLVAGIGTVAETPVAALAYDYTVMAGTQGFLNHKKTDRLLGVVHQDRLPLVLFAEGGGGRPGDTDVMGVAGLDLSSFASFARCSGQAPLVGVAAGYCFAGNAALLGCCDVVIATRDSAIGMGGPAMIEGGGLGVFRPEEVGPSDVQSANGVIDLLVDDEAAATMSARRYLGYFSGRIGDFACADQFGLRQAVPENRKRIYDMRALIGVLADTDSVLELRRGFGVGMITALIRIEGRAMGLLANNPAHLGGAIDAAAADKAARFLQLCDSHGLPVLSLCDTPGFMVGPDTERTAQVRHVCRLFVTGAALKVPVVCIVLRKGYGLGAMAMAAGGFHQTRLTASWPSGEFGGMGLEGAVRLGYRRELDAETDPRARQALFESLVARLYDEGQAINMAAYVEIDAVIDPAETRGWVARGLRAARVEGSRRFIDSW